MYQEVYFNRGTEAGGGGGEGGVNVGHSLSPPSHFVLATGLDYEDLDSWLLRKKQLHIDEKELKRKNKRNASRSFESTDI